MAALLSLTLVLNIILAVVDHDMNALIGWCFAAVAIVENSMLSYSYKNLYEYYKNLYESKP
jgi:hypothetical protein